MSNTVTSESFTSIASYFNDPKLNLRWDLIFVLPEWLKVWWQSFSSGAEPYLVSVREDINILGIAPLQLNHRIASFIGSADVCDYLDFVTTPGTERIFFTILIDDLIQKGVEQLDLVSLRPDSTVLTSLVPLAREREYEVKCEKKDVSLEMDLTRTWEEYLTKLDTKQRHEVRRKLGKLEKSGANMIYHTLEDDEAIKNGMDSFLKLFSESRRDKAAFMTSRMESFFRSLAYAMSREKPLRFGVLELNNKTSAMVMYFDYNNSVWLYNSGYNPDYRDLSVGLISKVLCIQDNIRKGRKKFDFLKGAELYKYYLGGSEVPIYHCQIAFKRE